MKIYVVTYENDGDFPDCDVVLATIDEEKAVETARNRRGGYTLSVVKVYEDNKYIGYKIYS